MAFRLVLTKRIGSNAIGKNIMLHFRERKEVDVSAEKHLTLSLDGIKETGSSRNLHPCFQAAHNVAREFITVLERASVKWFSVKDVRNREDQQLNVRMAPVSKVLSHYPHKFYLLFFLSVSPDFQKPNLTYIEGFRLAWDVQSDHPQCQKKETVFRGGVKVG